MFGSLMFPQVVDTLEDLLHSSQVSGSSPVCWTDPTAALLYNKRDKTPLLLLQIKYEFQYILYWKQLYTHSHCLPV